MIPWIDLETTGLDPRVDHILEVGVIITNDKLEYIDALELLVRAPEGCRGLASEYVQKLHDKTGLWDACASSSAMSVMDAEERIGKFMATYFEDPANKPPLGGSSVHFDRSFLAYWMPSVHNEFHYRNIDVSTIKELVKHIAPDKAYDTGNPEDKPHRAIQDLHNTLSELRYYVDTFFIKGLHGF